MATITTRNGKGSALTHTELDNNFTNLNTDKLEVSTAGTTYLAKAGGTMSGAIVFAGAQATATTAVPNIVLLTDSTSSISITTAATPNSVKTAYDTAIAALPLAGGALTGNVSLSVNNSTTGFFVQQQGSGAALRILQTGAGDALLVEDESGDTTPFKIDASGNTTIGGTLNKVTITAPATSATLTIADGKTLTASNTLSFTGTDSSSVAFGAGGTVAYTGGKLSQFAATTSAELAGVLSDETGTGALVFATSPTLVTPVLGTPSSGTLTSCTGLPISTGVAGLATGMAAFLGTPSSANLLAAVTNETGTGSLVFATSPTLVTPVLGAATATSINKVAITAPATSSTLTIADGKTLTASNTLTFTGTDASSVAFGAGGTVAYTGGKLSQFAATTSAELAGVLSDETGSGALVFATSPTLTTPALGVASATSINKVNITAPVTSSTLTIANGKTLTANNSITLAGTDSTTMTFPSSSATLAASNQTMNIGTTSVAINRASANLALTGISSVALPGSSSGTVTVQPAAAAGTYTLTLPNSAGSDGQVLSTNGSGTLSWVTRTEIPSGTAMIFAQTSAPTGWTKSTTHNDKALRVVNGTAGSGGSAAFTTAFTSRTPAGSVSGSNSGGAVQATTLSITQIPSHTHTYVESFLDNDTEDGNGTATNTGGFLSNTGAAGGGLSHNHSFLNPSWSGAFTGSAMDFAVAYVDVIIATKD